MNKLIIVSLALVGFLLMASNVLAQGPIEGCTLRHDISFDGTDYSSGAVITSTTGSWGMICLLDTVYTATDWIFYGLLSLVSIFVVYGGFSIVTAGGEEEKIKKGRDFVLYATVGLIVALLSRIIPSIAEGIVGT